MPPLKLVVTKFNNSPVLPRSSCPFPSLRSLRSLREEFPALLVSYPAVHGSRFDLRRGRFLRKVWIVALFQVRDTGRRMAGWWYGRTLLVVMGLATLVPARLGAAESARADLERRFDRTVRPFLEKYCLGCHGPEKRKGDLDLTPYTKMQMVLRDYERWKLVWEKLHAGEMPPEKAKQHPTPKDRQEIISWIEAARRWDATKNAGDPGIVLARRLSNEEYNYTVRDLTGVDLKPTREFPMDPSNMAGFDNSGGSLVMSPALLKKYLQAARAVASQMYLKPAWASPSPRIRCWLRPIATSFA